MGKEFTQPTTLFPILESDGKLRAAPQFRGFRKNADGAPTMLYHYAGLDIEDTVEPGKDGKSARQTLTIKGDVRPLIFRVKADNAAQGSQPARWSSGGSSMNRWARCIMNSRGRAGRMWTT